MPSALAPSPSAWFDRAVEGEDVAIRLPVGGIETRATTTFMDACLLYTSPSPRDA